MVAGLSTAQTPFRSTGPEISTCPYTSEDVHLRPKNLLSSATAGLKVENKSH